MDGSQADERKEVAMPREAVRIIDLRDDLVSVAEKTWRERGRPGLEGYYSIALGKYLEIIYDALRAKGYGENYSAPQRNVVFIVPGEDLVYTLDVATKFSFVDTQFFKSEGTTKRDNKMWRFYERIMGDEVYRDLPAADVASFYGFVRQACSEEVNQLLSEYIDFFLSDLVAEFIESHPITAADVDLYGGYPYMLFWSDTGEMLSEYDGEEWWCEHTIIEIQEMFEDIIAGLGVA